MLPSACDPHQETIGISSMQALLGEAHDTAHFHEMSPDHTRQSSKNAESDAKTYTHM